MPLLDTLHGFFNKENLPHGCLPFTDGRLRPGTRAESAGARQALHWAESF